MLERVARAPRRGGRRRGWSSTSARSRTTIEAFVAAPRPRRRDRGSRARRRRRSRPAAGSSPRARSLPPRRAVPPPQRGRRHRPPARAPSYEAHVARPARSRRSPCWSARRRGGCSSTRTGSSGARRARRRDAPRARAAGGEVVELPFAGVHVVAPALLDRITERGAFSILDVYLRLAAEGARILPFRWTAPLDRRGQTDGLARGVRPRCVRQEAPLRGRRPPCGSGQIVLPLACLLGPAGRASATPLRGIAPPAPTCSSGTRPIWATRPAPIRASHRAVPDGSRAVSCDSR